MVSFIDGAGLTAVIGTIRRAQTRRTRVAVVAPPGPIRRLLYEAGLDVIVDIFDTIDLALGGSVDQELGPWTVDEPLAENPPTSATNHFSSAESPASGEGKITWIRANL